MIHPFYKLIVSCTDCFFVAPFVNFYQPNEMLFFAISFFLKCMFKATSADPVTIRISHRCLIVVFWPFHYLSKSYFSEVHIFVSFFPIFRGFVFYFVGCVNFFRNLWKHRVMIRDACFPNFCTCFKIPDKSISTCRFFTRYMILV